MRFDRDFSCLRLVGFEHVILAFSTAEWNGPMDDTPQAGAVCPHLLCAEMAELRQTQFDEFKSLYALRADAALETFSHVRRRLTSLRFTGANRAR